MPLNPVVSARHPLPLAVGAFLLLGCSGCAT